MPYPDYAEYAESTHSIASPVTFERLALEFPDFIRSCASAYEPLPARFQQARRSSSVYTRNTQFISLHGTEEPVPSLPSSAFCSRPSSHQSHSQYQPEGNDASSPSRQSTSSSEPSHSDGHAEEAGDSEGVSPSTRLSPLARRYPDGVTSPDISPLMIPVSSSSPVDLPPPEAYLDTQYTPPPDTFYSEDTVTEAFDEPLFPASEVTTSPEAISASSQLMNPLLFGRHNKAYEALGISVPDASHAQDRRRTSSNQSHGYNRFRAALRSISRDDVQSIKQAPSHRSTSTSSRMSRASTQTVSTPATAMGVRQLLTDDYHHSISEQARSEREGSMSSLVVSKQMQARPVPLFFKDGSMRRPTKDDSSSNWPEFKAQSDRSSSEQEPESSTSAGHKVQTTTPKRSFTTRGRRDVKEVTPVPTSPEPSTPSTATTSPRTPTSSRPSTSTNPSSVASPVTPTLTRKDPPVPNRSMTAPGRLLLRATPGLFRTSSKKLQKSQKPSKKDSSASEKQEANDAWRQHIKQSIKVVGEKDPNEVGDVEQMVGSDKHKGSGGHGVDASSSNAVRDHLGWDRARAKTTR